MVRPNVRPNVVQICLGLAVLLGPGGWRAAQGKEEGNLYDHALSDSDYKFNMGDGYIFFEVTEPEELAYTYKVSPAPFAEPWNSTHYGIGLVPSLPECGCGSYFNAEQAEGKIAFVERGECSFVSKVLKAQEAGAVGVLVMDEDVEGDEMYIIMQDDTTGRDVDVRIPAGFLLGKNGFIIQRTLQKLHLDEAKINIPVNISTIPVHKLKQPPWIVW